MDYFTDPNHYFLDATDAFRTKKACKGIAGDILKLIREESVAPDLQYAWDKYQDPHSKALIEALLLAGASNDEIEIATGIPKTVMAIYRTHLFDTSVFRDRLERISYVMRMAPYIDDKYRRYYDAAITCGVPYLMWLITGKSDMSATEVLRQLMVDALFRSQAHRNAPLVSEVARQARSWSTHALSIAATLQRLQPEDAKNALEELQMALTHVDNTTNAKLSGLSPEKIMH